LQSNLGAGGRGQQTDGEAAEQRPGETSGDLMGIHMLVLTKVFWLAGSAMLTFISFHIVDVIERYNSVFAGGLHNRTNFLDF
jgi:hypothetical protein